MGGAGLSKSAHVLRIFCSTQTRPRFSADSQDVRHDAGKAVGRKEDKAAG
jgi:hypothetical protein